MTYPVIPIAGDSCFMATETPSRTSTRREMRFATRGTITQLAYLQCLKNRNGSTGLMFPNIKFANFKHEEGDVTHNDIH
eukprot:scaffold48309_cov39-Prasinocladus_malaysianus.AAC.1